MNQKQKIAFNTLVQIGGKLITAGVAFLITILVARQFGVEGYGEFTKIMTYVALFYLMGDFGFNAIILRQMETSSKGESLFSNLLGLRIILSVFLISLSFLILFFLPYNSLINQGFSPFVKLGIIIASLTILTQAIFTTTNVLFQKNLRYDQSVFAASFGSFITLISVAFFVFLRAPLLTIIASFIIGSTATAIVALNLASHWEKIRLAFNFSLWRRLFWQTLPLGLTLIFNLVYFRLDTLILTLLRPTFEVGIYGLAYKFFEFPLAIPTFFMNSLYPVMLKYKESPAKLMSLVKKTSFFLLVLSLFLLIFLFFLAPLLTLIRSHFSLSVLAFRILIASLPLFFLSSLFMWLLIALEKQSLLAFLYGLTMVFNIILNLIFIPQYGYLAAAVTTGLTELLILILTGFWGWQFLKRGNQ